MGKLYRGLNGLVTDTRAIRKDIHQKFNRLEGILVKLIDQQKKMQIEQKGLERSYKTLVEIIAKLSGNGLKHKFMNMLNKDE